MTGAEVTVARQPFVALMGDRRASARTSAPAHKKTPNNYAWCFSTKFKRTTTL